MLALVVTTGTFAYWASGVTGPANDTTVGTVTIGTGEAITTEYVITGDPQSVGNLVPNTYEDGVTTFNSRTITWGIQWADDGTANANANGATGDISATYTWVAYALDGVTVIANSAGSVTTYSGTITVTPGANPTSMTLDAAQSTFSWAITMGEPSSKAQYDLIAGGSIVVTITYEITNVTAN
jgi:hypothetical protein